MLLVGDDTGLELAGESGLGDALAPRIAQDLRKHGVTFTQGYTTVSSCSPSRGAILTGLPPHQNGLWGLAQTGINFRAYDDIHSLPNLLRESGGYMTAAIGKYHLNPVAPFDFDLGLGKKGLSDCWAGGLPFEMFYSECARKVGYNSLSRNVTAIGEHTSMAFEEAAKADQPLFLLVAFGDSHRCGDDPTSKTPVVDPNGLFCEKYGTGGAYGTDERWKPQTYTRDQVTVPPWLPDTSLVRDDLCAYYTALNRLDQAAGAVIDEIEKAGATDDTLVILVGDNGSPYPSAKTNLKFTQGVREPFVVKVPASATEKGKGNLKANTVDAHVTSTLDIVPTVLDYAGIQYPSNATAGGVAAVLTGNSLLQRSGGARENSLQYVVGSNSSPRRASLVEEDSTKTRDSSSSSSSSNRDLNYVFHSHNFHGLTEPWPSRAVTSSSFRYTINYFAGGAYPILGDVQSTPMWREIVDKIAAGKPTGWLYSMEDYENRDLVELCDLINDPFCTKNVAGNATYENVETEMANILDQWQKRTNDVMFPKCAMPIAKSVCTAHT